MRSHQIDYQVFGDDLQFVEIELDPDETVIAEAGTMMYVEQGINFEAKLGDGTTPDAGFWGKAKQVGKRAITGESLFITHFTNQGQAKQKVAFAAPYPGKIVPVDLAQAGGRLLCQKDAFLAAAMGTTISINFSGKIGRGLFGGEGFILQDIQGDGLMFMHAGGAIIPKYLNNETLRVDTGCLVAFQPQINYDIQRSGSLKSMVFGGEGLFLATLQGTGWVWLQSLPFSRLAERVLANLAPGSSNDSGSVLGPLSNLFEGR
ncbi:MAG: TIGR00266 family protein [Actinomycetota bacterium]|nr:TIGR00266 family protein [Actinomycetota bacterium]